MEMSAEEEPAYLEEQGETDSVSLICQERVDEAVEARKNERRGALEEAGASQGEVRREESDVDKEETEAEAAVFIRGIRGGEGRAKEGKEKECRAHWMLRCRMPKPDRRMS